MKRTYKFEKSLGNIIIKTKADSEIEIPIFQGILKHPHNEELPELLSNFHTACKYTIQAIKFASWPLLRQFPASWILTCMEKADIPENRRQAIKYLLLSRL